MKYKHKYGYTLIELLLVITIITSLTATSISIYHHRQINSRIEKTAIETENFLSAALNYETENGTWPTANSDLNTCSTVQPTENLFITEYIPNQSVKSRLGYNYCWAPLNNSQHLFWVAIKIPHNNIQLAHQLAAKLPNAVITTNPQQQEIIACSENNFNGDCYVRVELSNTGIGAESSGTYLAGVGECKTKNIISGSGKNMRCEYRENFGDEPVTYQITFNCPAGMQGNVIANANFFDIGKANGLPFSLRTMNVTTKKCESINGAANTSCILEINAMRANEHSIANGAGGYVGATYTAYCSKKNITPYNYG